MTTLPKHLEEMQKKRAQYAADHTSKDGDTVYHYTMWGFQECFELMLKDMESMAKALDKVCKRNDIPGAVLDYYGDCAMALKIWREKYGIVG